jgi:hypothetical protein
LRKAIAAAAALAALGLPAAVGASTVTYAGKFERGGTLALDVKFKHHEPKRVLQARGRGFRFHCQKSGNITGSIDFPAPGDPAIKIEEGEFRYRTEQPGSGRVSKLDGEFKRRDRKVTGIFVFSYHFEAGKEFPEENCTTRKLNYSVRKGAPDKTAPLVASAIQRVGA